MRALMLGWGGLTLSTALWACASNAPPAEANMLGNASASGQLLDLEQAAPIADATVCLFERTEVCTTTDAEGAYRLEGLPDDAELLISLEAAGFARGLRMLRTVAGGDVDLHATLLPDVGMLATERGVLGIEAVGDTGYLAFYAVDADLLPVVNVRAFLAPNAGDGPFYFNADRRIDPVLTTGASASGYFFNLPPAEYALTMTSLGAVSDTPCVHELEGLSWGLTAATGHRVPVVANAVTFVIPVCDAVVDNR